MNWIYTINFYLEKIGTLNNTRSEENLVVPRISVHERKDPQNNIKISKLLSIQTKHLEYEYFRLVNIFKNNLAI